LTATITGVFAAGLDFGVNVLCDVMVHTTTMIRERPSNYPDLDSFQVILMTTTDLDSQGIKSAHHQFPKSAMTFAEKTINLKGNKMSDFMRNGLVNHFLGMVLEEIRIQFDSVFLVVGESSSPAHLTKGILWSFGKVSGMKSFPKQSHDFGNFGFDFLDNLGSYYIVHDHNITNKERVSRNSF